MQNAVAHNKGLARVGRCGEPFGLTAPPMKARCAQISSPSRPRGRGTSEPTPTSNAMTPTSGPMNSPSSANPARPTSKPNSFTTTALMSTLPEMAGLDARDPASPAGGLGQVRSFLRHWRARALPQGCPNAQVHVIDAGHFALDSR